MYIVIYIISVIDVDILTWQGRVTCGSRICNIDVDHLDETQVFPGTPFTNIVYYGLSKHGWVIHDEMWGVISYP